MPIGSIPGTIDGARPSVIRVEHVTVRANEGVSGLGFEFRSGHQGATAEIFEE